MDWALDQLLQDHPDDPQEEEEDPQDHHPVLIRNDELSSMCNNNNNQHHHHSSNTVVDSTDFIDQLHNLLTHSEDTTTTNCAAININLPSPPPPPPQDDIGREDGGGDVLYADAMVDGDMNANSKGVVVVEEGGGGVPGLFPSYPPVLSPPEEYRDDSSPMAVERSMTLDLTYPEEESKSQLQQQAREHRQLPGQQDLGPQATFPYNHHHQQDHEAFSDHTNCADDVGARAESFLGRFNLKKCRTDKQPPIFKQLATQSQPTHHPPPPALAPMVQSKLASASPILSLMLSEPTTKQKQAYSGTISTDHDSGIESLDSLSPKDMHSTPISSPIAMSSVSNASNIVPEQSAHSASNPKDNVSVLTSLLSAPSKDMSCSTTISPKLLSTFLTSVRPEVKKINVLTINPHNLTLVSEAPIAHEEVQVESTMDVTIQSGDHELSLADFLDGCAKVVNAETSTVVRSSLEDFDKKVIGNNEHFERKIFDIGAPEAPEKHDEFDYIMGQLSDKVVPSWDTDLTFRLKQLDHVLAAGATQNNYRPNSNFAPSSSTSDEDESSESRKRYACPHCDKRFSHCGARNSHRRKVHERNYLCHECDIAFGSAQKLERHMKTHTGIKEFKCETCGKEFMIERNLVLHYKLHRGEKDFICSICHRTYYTKSGLQAHNRQMHLAANSNDPFMCKHCSFQCSTRHELLIHRKEIHAGDVFAEKCPECPHLSFRTLTELKRHTISDHSNRPFPCSKCPHRSKTLDKLERHLLSHSTPRDTYQCPHCMKNFAFKNSLKKHMEKGRCDVLKRLQKDATVTYTITNNNIVTSNSIPNAAEDVMTEEHIDLLL